MEKPICILENCGNPVKARGLCAKHYQRLQKVGSPHIVRKPGRTFSAQEVEAKFWSKVRRGSEQECWEWQGQTRVKGYGRIGMGGKYFLTHRYAWSLANGFMPEPGQLIMHTCDNPPCCNPAHLVLGTHKTNATDRDAKGRGYWPGTPKPKAAHVGERNPNAKIGPDDVRAIRADEDSHSVCAAKYGVTKGLIARIRRRELWKHLTS